MDLNDLGGCCIRELWVLKIWLDLGGSVQTSADSDLFRFALRGSKRIWAHMDRFQRNRLDLSRFAWIFGEFSGFRCTFVVLADVGGICSI